MEKKKKEVSSAVTVPNNKSAPEGAEDGSIDGGKRPDLGILITGLPARSSGELLLHSMYDTIYRPLYVTNVLIDPRRY